MKSLLRRSAYRVQHIECKAYIDRAANIDHYFYRYFSSMDENRYCCRIDICKFHLQSIFGKRTHRQTIILPAFSARGMLRQHRTMGATGFSGSFAPIVQYEKWEIHPVFPHFPYFRLGQNLALNLLAPLCGDALNLFCSISGKCDMITPKGAFL